MMSDDDDTLSVYTAAAAADGQCNNDDNGDVSSHRPPRLPCIKAGGRDEEHDRLSD